MQQREQVRYPWWYWGTALLILLGGGFMVAGVLTQTPVVGLLRPWYLSRASGLVAFALLWLSVLIGLLQSCGLLKGVTNAAANIDLHDFTGVASILATVFHLLILVFDHYIRLTVIDVLLPFAASYKPLLTTYGILALYLSVLATVTSYLRSSMSAKTWRTIHLSSLVGFVMALCHGFAMGSDTRLTPVFFFYLIAGASIGLLTLYRIWISAQAQS